MLRRAIDPRRYPLTPSCPRSGPAPSSLPDFGRCSRSSAGPEHGRASRRTSGTVHRPAPEAAGSRVRVAGRTPSRYVPDLDDPGPECGPVTHAYSIASAQPHGEHGRAEFLVVLEVADPPFHGGSLDRSRRGRDAWLTSSARGDFTLARPRGVLTLWWPRAAASHLRIHGPQLTDAASASRPGGDASLRESPRASSLPRRSFDDRLRRRLDFVPRR